MTKANGGKMVASYRPSTTKANHCVIEELSNNLRKVARNGWMPYWMLKQDTKGPTL